MVVDLSIFVIPSFSIFIFFTPLVFKLLLPEGVHVCMDKNFNEGKQKIKDKPDINHLDVGSFWQGVGDADEPEVEEVRSELVHLYFSGII